MPSNIMIVDDNQTILDITVRFLDGEDYLVKPFLSPSEALNFLDKDRFDMIISDFFMPEMNGDQFFKAARQKIPDIPFIFLTTNEDIKIAIELMRMGANDYLSKPLIKEVLLFRVAKNLQEAENVRIARRVGKEQEIKEVEEKRLVNWQSMYALKDTRLSDQIITLFTKTVNRSGIFILIEMLKNQLERIDDNFYKIPSQLASLIIEAGKAQEETFNQINLVNEIDKLTVSAEVITVSRLYELIIAFFRETVAPLLKKYGKPLLIRQQQVEIRGNVRVDLHYFKKILTEVCINALKYSPRHAVIESHVEVSRQPRGRQFSIVVRNPPKTLKKSGPDGEGISGIPYEYSEMVFDLLYRLDDEVEPLEEEEWKGGIGLYVCRKIIRSMNGWIRAANGLDYTEGSAKPFVGLTISLPLLD